MEAITEGVNNINISDSYKKNRIQVSNTKKPLFSTLISPRGNETFERLAVFGLFANFMVYLTRELHLDQVYAANIVSIWFGVTNFAPLFGAFISDAYIGRFCTIALASFATLSERLDNEDEPYDDEETE